MNALESIPFDTCRFVKRMTGAGMPLGQAEELADALAGEHKDLFKNNFATRRDVEELKHGLAVVKAGPGMVKWIVSGVGFGMLLLLTRSFWPLRSTRPRQPTASPAACRSA